MMNRHIASLVLALLAIGVSKGQESGPRSHDFEGQRGLKGQWVAGGGKISVSRRVLENPGATAAGRGVFVDASPKTAFQTKDHAQVHLERATAVRFAIKAEDASVKAPRILEFQVFTRQRGAWFWRKFRLEDSKWHTIELPLSRFRWSAGAVPRWEEAWDIGFRFRNGGRFQIDSIEWVLGDGKQGAYLDVRELASEAFGERVPLLWVSGFAVFAEKPCEPDRLVPVLDWLRARLHGDFPALKRPERPVPLLVFANRERYRDFWPRFAESFASTIAAPNSDGFAALGIATSYAKGAGPQPVFLQEACHAYLTMAAGIPPHQDWLQEGLANHYQTLGFKQRNLQEIIRRGVGPKGSRLPLERLTDGGRISTRSYWQALSFVRWLLADDQRRQGLWTAMQQFKERRSTKLAPVCEQAFGKDLATLEAEWLAWARAR